MEKKKLRRPLNWLLPLAFALPVLAVLAYGAIRWGQMAQNALNIAAKMVVIP